MKIVIRNFMSIFRRFKVAMLLNIIGLAVALAAFLVILMQIKFERNFDRCHPNADRIYRVDLAFENGGSGMIHQRPFLGTFFKSSPHIEAGSILNPYVRDAYLSVVNKGEKSGFKESIVACDPEITKIFDFEMLEGERSCLSEPGQVLIPQSLAKKLFGDQPAVGQSILLNEPIWNVKDEGALQVGGVYKDFPDNTQLNNAIYSKVANDYSVDDWRSSNYIGYVLLDRNVDPDEVAKNFNDHFDYSKIEQEGGKVKIQLIPLTKIYYMNESQDGRIVKSGNPDTPNVLLAIALLVIAVAIVNFTNFSTSIAPLRIKSMNTQKVLGGSQTKLRAALVFESVVICLCSFGLSLVLVEILRLTRLLTFVQSNLLLSDHVGLLLLTGGLSILIGMVAGLYPAWFVTSFQPAIALKGAFGLSVSGRRLRTGLIAFQFIISIGLIITSLFINEQNQYMRHYRLGFDKDQLAIVELSRSMVKNNREAYANKLKENPGIADVAFSAEKFGAADSYATWGGEYKNQQINFYSFFVSWNFLDVMGIDLLSGRKPTAADERGEEPVFLVMQRMQKQYGMEPGERLRIGWMHDQGQEIVGVVDNVTYQSLRQEAYNIVFVVNHRKEDEVVSYIRINAGSNIDEVVKHIRKTVKELDPTYPFDVEFYDRIFNHLYKKENDLSKMISLFSLLAIMISLSGVFALVIFETQYRRKEIGIRKVYGSTGREILLMFNRSYLGILAVCFLIAAPLAWYGIFQWLKNFAYKTPIHWWIFLLAFLVIALITIATVSFQSWRAANENPVKSIKTE